MRRASILLATVLLAGCHATSAGLWAPGRMTPEAEALAGMRAAPSLEARHGGVVRDADAERHMQGIGQRLCEGTAGIRGPYQYRLLGSGRLNASSLPGGRVYVTRGLYHRLESNQQVAAVLAHEIAHIVSKDHFKPRCASGAEAIDREISADCLAAAYLQSAGIEPQAMIEVVRIIADAQPKGWSECRVRSLRRRIGRADKLSLLAQN